VSYITAQLRARNRQLGKAIENLRENVKDARSYREHRFSLLRDMANSSLDNLVDVVHHTITMGTGELLAYGVECDLRDYDQRQTVNAMASGFTELLREATKRRQLPCEVRLREREHGVTIELVSVRLAP
jgi:hypothetical protein